MPSETPLLVHANFLDDLRALLTARMAISEVSVSPNADVETVLVQYLNSQRRLIETRSRQVFWSRELLARTLPSVDSLGIRAIEKTSIGGENLNPYLSTRVRKASDNDILLNDWGIYHMHLGLPGGRPSPFVARTRALLYAYVAEEALYFVDVLSHESFNEQALIEVVHSNWPYLLARHRALEMPDQQPLSREQHARRRGIGANALTQMADGTVYFPPGGGYVATGLSLEVRIAADVRYAEICRWESWCKENGGILATSIFEKTQRSLPELRLALQFEEDNLLVVETQSGVRFKLDEGAATSEYLDRR